MPENRPSRLDSWKEIAEFLGRDVRTAIRWEKERGLPVHRIPGGKRPGVYAVVDELAAWRSAVDLRCEPSAGDAKADTATGITTDKSVVARIHLLTRIGAIAAVFALFAMALLFWARETRASANRQSLSRPLAFARADYGAATPLAIATADFNGDQRLDLLFTNSADDSLALLLGDGHGGFRPGTRISVGREPERLAVGDFNNDGKIDVAITHRVSGEVRVLLGNGEGGFKEAFRWPNLGRCRWISAADFNHDGKLDLAIAQSSRNRMTILLGNGDGTFSKASEYDTGEEPSALLVADFTAHGTPDIVLGDYRIGTGNTISLYRGRGDGTFGPRQVFGTGKGPLGMAVADLNGDGKPDIVTANLWEGVSVLLGNASGTFARQSDAKAGAANGYVVVGDFDQDGIPDLAVLGEHSNTVSLLFGKGDGQFWPKQDLSTGAYPDAAVIGDFDNDGRLDLAVANTYGNSISVYLNRGKAFERKSLTALLRR